MANATAPYDTHFVAILICREGRDGREYLVIEYDSGDGKQVKFPGGTNNDHPGEQILDTLAREALEETGLVIPRHPPQVWAGPKVPNKGDKPGFHQKFAFIIPEGACQGTMRTMPLTDNGDKLSPPFWRTEAELLVEVNKGGLFFTHREMLHSAKGYQF